MDDDKRQDPNEGKPLKRKYVNDEHGTWKFQYYGSWRFPEIRGIERVSDKTEY